MFKRHGKSVKNEMLNYMKDRYNENFECDYLGSESWSSPFIEMTVHSEKFPQAKITVHKSGSIMSDNYTDFLMKEKIEDEITKITAKIYPECKVINDNGGIPLKAGTVEPDMSIAEYSKKRYISLSIVLCIYDPDCETNKDQKLEEFRKNLAEKKYKCNLLIFYMKENKLQLIDDSNWSEFLTGSNDYDWAIIRGDITVNDEFDFNLIDWRSLI